MPPPVTCPECGRPGPPLAARCPACGAPFPAAWDAGFPPDRPSRPGTVREILAEYLALDQLGPLLASPKFWMLYSLAAVPIVLEWAEIGAQGMFFYFSLFWALLFHRLVAPERGTGRLAALVAVATVFVVMPLLVAWLRIPPDLVSPLVRSRSPVPARLLGFVLGVGLREEAFKAAPVLYLVWLAGRARGRPLSLREGLFLGAVSGLAFAAVENVDYLRQFEELDAVRQSMGYLSWLTFEGGMSRLLLTPFMHGAWSGIVGYFLAAGGLDPLRRRALAVAGLALAALLHGTYNTVAGSPPLTLLAIGLTFYLLTKCVSRATEEPSVAAVAERV